MNDLTKQLLGTYDPVQALIIYKNGDAERYYIESHQIEHGQMLAGTPLDGKTLEAMVEYYSEQQKATDTIKGIIPHNLLYCEWNAVKKIMIWYNEPQRRNMVFVQNLEIPLGVAWQPGIVYVVNNGSLAVLAYKSEGRPQDNEKLYRPPYHNCNSIGTVCLGSAKTAYPKELTYSAMMAYYETLFWASEFSHLAGVESLVKGNLNLYWKSAIKGKSKFDTSILMSLKPKLTVKQLLEKYTK
jgi:PRTRC genetic system protein B